jgi:hypothetical protein
MNTSVAGILFVNMFVRLSSWLLLMLRFLSVSCLHILATRVILIHNHDGCLFGPIR